MDSKWTIQTEIKKEEPVEYNLILSTHDGEPIADEFPSHRDEDHNNMLVSHPMRVKQESNKEFEHGFEPVQLSKIKMEESDQGTSEFEPSPGHINGKDKEFGDRTTKKSTEKCNYREISIVEDIACEGPPFTCSLCSLTFPEKNGLAAHHSIHKGKKFQCNQCKKLIATKSGVQRHMKIHTGPKFSCPICFKSFSVKVGMICHQSVHEGNQFECDICSNKYARKDYLVHHMKIHGERTRKFECQLCDKAYYAQKVLNRHMRDVHSNSKRQYRCPNATCDRIYASLESFRRHGCDGRRLERFKTTNCSMCDKRFFFKDELKEHMKRMHVAKPEKFKCDDCNKTYSYNSWSSYVLHVAQKCALTIMYECYYCAEVVKGKAKLIKHFVDQHNLEITSNSRCQQCYKMFSSRKKLNLHFRKHHQEFKCEYCFTSFKSKTHRSLHQKNCIPKKTFEKYSKDATSTDVKMESHQCKICECSFINEMNLLEHMTEVHLDNNIPTVQNSKYVCSVCNHSFKTDITLSLHKLRIHKYNQSFKCPKCLKKFKGEKNFQHHSKSECVTVGSTFQCTFCSKLYPSNRSLKTHLQRVHSRDEKPVCNICNKSFASKPALKLHMKKGDHPINLQCEFCQRNFKRTSSYTTHLMNCKLNPKEKLHL